MELRTLSVGDYDSLFVAEEDPEAVEAARQQQLADQYFTFGNIYYWSTLTILLIAAVVQRDFYESRFGGGPPHLDMSLAVPQGIRRGFVFVISLYVTAKLYVEGWEMGYVGVLCVISLWSG